MTAARGTLVQVAAFVVVLGVPDGALGVLWPSMRTTFHRPVGDLGYVAVAATVLYIAGGVAFAAVAARVHATALVVWSCAAAALAAAGWALAGSWAVVLVAVAVFGLGRGVLDAAANAGSSADLRLLGWLHAGWSVGGAIGPVLVAGLVAVSSWRSAVWVLAVAAAGVALLSVGTRALGAGLRRPAAPVADGLRSPRHRRLALAAVLAAFVAYTAAEIGPVAWAYVVLTEHRGLGDAGAAAAVAGFWLALTAGRVTLGAVGHRLDQRRILDGSGLMFVVALGMFWAGPTGVAVAALPLAGLATAAVFPVLVAVTPVMVGAATGDAAVGLAIAAAAVGGPVAVLVEGQLANRHGTGVLDAAMFVAAAVMLVALVGVRVVHRCVVGQAAR